MFEFLSEKSEMPDVAFAQGVMRDYVANRPGDNIKFRLASAANALGWSLSRAKAVLYGEARRIEAKEMDQLCRAAKVERRVMELTDDREQLAARLARMEAMLAALLASVEGRAASETGAMVREQGAPVGAGASTRNP